MPRMVLLSEILLAFMASSPVLLGYEILPQECYYCMVSSVGEETVALGVNFEYDQTTARHNLQPYWSRIASDVTVSN